MLSYGQLPSKKPKLNQFKTGHSTLIISLSLLAACAEGVSSSNSKRNDDMQVTSDGMTSRSIDMKIRSEDMQVIAEDMLVIAEDMLVISEDMLVTPADMDILPTDMEVRPIDMEIPSTICGDGEVHNGEECDHAGEIDLNCDYGRQDCQVCNAECELVDGQTTYCGDGEVQANEACDPGNNIELNCDYGQQDCQVCNADCELVNGQTAFCGDGEVQADESCDAGENVDLNCDYGQQSCQVCDDECALIDGQTAYCGDGEIQANENCDAGETINLNCEYGQQSCQVCDAECELVNGQTAYCGDGEIQAIEDCDRAGLLELDCVYGQQSCQVCNVECELINGQTAYCGDGEITHGERCDQGQANSDVVNNACRTDCHLDHRDALVPFLQDSYIVQGVASSCEARPAHECIDERLYLSLYFKDAAGHDASEDGFTDRNSIIVELNPSTATFDLTRCWLLSGEIEDSHVGGLAFARSQQGISYLYASGASQIERYTLPSLAQDPELNPYQPNYGSLASCGTLGDQTNRAWPVSASSFVSHVVIEQTDYLMVGQFCNDSSCTAQAYAYQLNLNDGTIQSGAADQTFKIRQKAQGVDVNGAHLYVSVSYGDNDSYIYKESLNAARCENTNCEGAEVENLGRVTVKGGVAGGEDLARVGQHLWSASESGSRYFQNRPVWQFPWSSYFPYIYDLPISNTFASSETDVNQAIRSRHTRDEVILLSNRYASWWNRSERLWVLDVNGDGADDMLLGPNQSDGCWYLLEGHQGAQSGEFIDRGCVVQAYASWWNNTDRIRVMDVNGDHRDDIVIGPYSSNGCWYILQGRSSGQGASLTDRGCVVEYKDNWSSKSERIRPLDVNGDGADDIVIGPSSAGAWYLLEGRVGSVADFNAGRTLSGPDGSYGGWWDNPDRIKTLDANGDGRGDIVIGPYSENGCWYILQGSANPTDFVDRGCVRQAYENWSDSSDRFWIADFSGDGRDDIILGPSGVNGNWYMLAGSGVNSVGLNYEGAVHSNYENWYDNPRRINIMHPKANGPAAILIGAKKDLGEWQLLQGHSDLGFYDKQWAVDWREDWGAENSDNKPERIHIMDLNGDGADDIVIGPSSNGNWYLLETLSE